MWWHEEEFLQMSLGPSFGQNPKNMVRFRHIPNITWFAARKWLVILTIAFVTKTCNCDVASFKIKGLVPCGSHLWAMQPRWSTATIEIHPYKDPCHCNNILVTLITVVSNPIGLLWYQKQITCEAAGQDYLTDNPGNIIHKVTTTVLSWKFALHSNRWLPYRCLWFQSAGLWL